MQDAGVLGRQTIWRRGEEVIGELGAAGCIASVLTRRSRPWVLLAGAATLAYILWAVFTDEGLRGRYLVTQILYFLVGAISVFLAMRLAWNRAAHRRYVIAWGLLGTALAVFWLGDALWVSTEVAKGGVESPTWADALYLAYYPLLLAGLVLLSDSSKSRTERVRAPYDIAIVCAGGGVLVWYAVLRPVLADLDLSLGDFVSLAYCLGDLALLGGLATLLVQRSRVNSRWTFVLLLGAVLVGFAADLAYGYVDAVAGFIGGGFIDILYVVSWFLFGLAASCEQQTLRLAVICGASGEQMAEPSEAEDMSTTGEASSAGAELRSRGLSYVATGIAALMWVWALWESLGTRAVPAVIVAAIVTALVAARYILVVRENAQLREIEARRASERRLQENLRRTQFLVDHAPDLVFWVDKHGRIVEANEAACQVLGYSKTDLVGRSISHVDLGMGNQGEQWQAWWHGLRDQRQRAFETLYRTSTGDTVPVEVKSGYLEFEGKEYCCSFARDVRERKNSEAALRDAEAQLRQSQKMEAIGQLAGGIAHDFNNLLTAILGYTDLVLAQGDRLMPTVREDVAEIKTAAERAATLTRQILAFSRRQPLQAKVVDVNETVSEMGRMLSRTLGEQVDLVLRLNLEPVHVEVDRTQFEQVIMNLAVNARDAMPNGGTLTIETALVDLDSAWCARHSALRPGPHVMVAMSDTGCGMDEETKARAFEPFFTTKPSGRGTGLGLSMVYGTVSQSNGAVFIYSEPGQGTTVKVYLPRVASPLQDKSAVVRQADPGVTGDRAGEDGRAACSAVAGLGDEQGVSGVILVVEDETWIRELVVKVLESRGHQVRAVASGEEAIALLDDDGLRIDLLLTDLVLPGPVQGLVLADKARAQRTGLPVVYTSGYTREAILGAGWPVQGANYLEKPFTRERLIFEVENALRSATLGRSLGP